MIARQDRWVERTGGCREKRLSTLCRRHTRIYAQIYMQSASYSRDALPLSHFLSHPLVPLPTLLSSALARLTHPGPIIQTWGGGEEGGGTPLTGIRIPDITFTHVILHQFLKQRQRMYDSENGTSCVGWTTKLALQFCRNQRVIFCFFLSLFFVNLPVG